MTETQERGNKILAYFMKVEWSPELNYHEDWNRLMPVWKALWEEHKWGAKAPYLDEWGNITKLNGIESAILRSDINESWGYITGFINKYILTEEEYQKFK
jgi:hypothetical protein